MNSCSHSLLFLRQQTPFRWRLLAAFYGISNENPLCRVSWYAWSSGLSSSDPQWRIKKIDSTRSARSITCLSIQGSFGGMERHPGFWRPQILRKRTRKRHETALFSFTDWVSLTFGEVAFEGNGGNKSFPPFWLPLMIQECEIRVYLAAFRTTFSVCSCCMVFVDYLFDISLIKHAVPSFPSFCLNELPHNTNSITVHSSKIPKAGNTAQSLLYISTMLI